MLFRSPARIALIAKPDDAIKAILAGADAIQLVSAVLRHGPAYIHFMSDRLVRWMEAHGCATLDDFRGRLGLSTTADPTLVERAQYMRTLTNWRGTPAVSVGPDAER